MALRLLLDEYDWPISDFGRQINFTIYDETQSAFNASTFQNAVLKTFDRDGNQTVPDIPVTWTTQSSGIGYFQYTQNSRINVKGDYYVCIQMWDNALTKQISTSLLRITATIQPSTN